MVDRGIAALVAVGLALAATGEATAGQLRVSDPAEQRRLSGAMDRMFEDFLRNRQPALPGGEVSGPGAWFDPNGGARMLSSLAPADAAFGRRGLQMMDLVRRLGGEPANRRQFWQRDGERTYVALEGRGGGWFDSISLAEGYLFRLLLESSLNLPPAVEQAVAETPGNDIGTLLPVAQDAAEAVLPVLPLGGTVTVTLNSNAFAQASLPQFQGPAGVAVRNLRRIDSQTVEASVAAAASVPAGPAVLYAYAPNTSFRSIDSFPVYFTAASGGGGAAPADDHAADVAGATPLGATGEGVLEVPGDEDLFRITLTVAGRLTLTSTGPTDVRFTLEDADGVVLAANDDGGAWYNAELSHDLTAGLWYLRVSHCCQGTGGYSLSRGFVPG